MNPDQEAAKVNRFPGEEESVPDDHLAEYSDEDREIEDRKPDLGEIEGDTSEL
jgi:hypothetical protein